MVNPHLLFSLECPSLNLMINLVLYWVWRLVVSTLDCHDACRYTLGERHNTGYCWPHTSSGITYSHEAIPNHHYSWDLAMVQVHSRNRPVMTSTSSSGIAHVHGTIPMYHIISWSTNRCYEEEKVLCTEFFLSLFVLGIAYAIQWGRVTRIFLRHLPYILTWDHGSIW